MSTSTFGRALDRLRQPEYTGENRCIPCTVTNIFIAVALSTGVAIGTAGATASPNLTAVASSVVLLGGLLSIYFRGYLIPGTPTLTKQYFPDRVLKWFDKADDQPVVSREPADDVDVEGILVDAGVLEEQPDDDLGLTPAFTSAWRERIEAVRTNDEGRAAFAEIVGIDAGELEFEDFGGDAFLAGYQGRQVGRWESQAAFTADAAAGEVLPDFWDGWGDAEPAVRGQLLAGLRLFIESCPACDGAVAFGQDTVESCCRTTEVVAVTCQECDSRLFEIPVDSMDVEAAEA